MDAQELAERLVATADSASWIDRVFTSREERLLLVVIQLLVTVLARLEAIERG